MTWTKIFSFWLWGGLQNWSRGDFGFGFGVGFDSKVGVGSDSAWSGLQFGRRDWFLIPALGWAYNFLKYFGFWFNCCRFVIFYGWYRVGKYRAGTVFPERKFVVVLWRTLGPTNMFARGIARGAEDGVGQGGACFANSLMGRCSRLP